MKWLFNTTYFTKNQLTKWLIFPSEKIIISQPQGLFTRNLVGFDGGGIL
jgi:hypothetical protein